MAHINVDDSLAISGLRSAVITIPGKDTQTLWFESYDGSLGPESGADSFLLASLLLFMESGHDVHVGGKVTRRLIRNLVELQEVWASWRPEKYSRIHITADEITEDALTGGPSIVAFSGGVDAAYSVRRHTSGASDSLFRLRGALFVHGFDIPLSSSDDYVSARRRGENMLAGSGLESLGVRTNLRELGQDWQDVFGLAVAACLSLFQHRFSAGLIGSSEPYDALILPWGSSPVTDHLYGTGHMDMIHDGAGASRTDKIAMLAEWPEAMDYLRVCWQGERSDRNCGLCEKCIRTYLNFRAAGVDNPRIFERTPSESAIRMLKAASPPLINELRSVAKHAADHKTGGTWLPSLKIAILLNEVRVRAKQHKGLVAIARKLSR